MNTFAFLNKKFRVHGKNFIVSIITQGNSILIKLKSYGDEIVLYKIALINRAVESNFVLCFSHYLYGIV